VFRRHAPIAFSTLDIAVFVRVGLEIWVALPESKSIIPKLQTTSSKSAFCPAAIAFEFRALLVGLRVCYQSGSKQSVEAEGLADNANMMMSHGS
jgi:hypothetical protein